MRTLWDFYKKIDPGISLAGYVWTALAGSTIGAAVIAWATTFWEWYWLTLKWAGIPLAFLFGWFVISVCIFLTGYGIARWRGEQRQNLSDTQPAELSERQTSVIYPPTVTTTPPKISAALYVSDIRLTFDALEKERHSELTMRVFNGTGRVIDFANLSGHIKFNAPNNTDPARMGELPTPTLRADVARSIVQLQEWHLTLDQRVPAVEADKILAMLKDDVPVSFDLSGLNIGVADHDRPQEIERLPTWHGVRCQRGIRFDRIINAAGNVKGKAALVMD